MAPAERPATAPAAADHHSAADQRSAADRHSAAARRAAADRHSAADHRTAGDRHSAADHRPAASPLRARARDVFAALIDAAVVPGPPLPALTRDGAPAFLDRLLVASPRANAAGLVGALLLLDAVSLPLTGARFRRLSAERRRALLDRADRWPPVQALRGLAHLAYYGEDAAALALGYDADAVLARARA
jgi:hypothetical protein